MEVVKYKGKIKFNNNYPGNQETAGFFENIKLWMEAKNSNQRRFKVNL